MYRKCRCAFLSCLLYAYTGCAMDAVLEPRCHGAQNTRTWQVETNHQAIDVGLVHNLNRDWVQDIPLDMSPDIALPDNSPSRFTWCGTSPLPPPPSADLQYKYGRLTCTKLIEVDRLGSEVRVSAVFKFSLINWGCPGWEGNCSEGIECPEEYVRGENMSRVEMSGCQCSKAIISELASAKVARCKTDTGTVQRWKEHKVQ